VKVESGQTLLEVVAKAEESEKHHAALAPIRLESEVADLFGRSRFVWVAVGETYRLNLGDGHSVICSPVGAGGYRVFVMEESRTIPLYEGVLSLGYAQGVAEDYARKNTPPVLIYKDAKWRAHPASEKQINLMKRIGIAYSPEITKGEAARLIDEVMNQPATDRQLFFIQTHGLHAAPSFLTKKEARNLIAQYKSEVGATA
jgi:hypothetical protein